ncbi:uncharacterized protein EAE97_006765 [Botrytis byssoidea]|uniref:Uncharacterized protein n=1 Tax=Botrytis byssoidea TaxID=139641 RepID=A0A9P5M515_9HELO|nr:uncharacterized protein EAE97_006765 [Botrytis byssoidea]KAF7941928.1 hypothetical protein EAE97_006765 [Botrytis byssoidea]
MCHIARFNTPPRMNIVWKWHSRYARRNEYASTAADDHFFVPNTNRFHTSITLHRRFEGSKSLFSRSHAVESTIGILGRQGKQSKAFQQRRRDRIDQDANKKLTTMVQSFMDLLLFDHDNSPSSSRAFQRKGHKSSLSRFRR